MTITPDQLAAELTLRECKDAVADRVQDCRAAFMRLETAMGLLHALIPGDHLCSFGLSTKEFPPIP